MAQKKTGTGTKVAEAAAGLAAVGAAAAAGYYFYGSKGAKKHRKIAAKWAAGMQKEVIQRAKKLPKMDAAAIAGAVDSAMTTYKGVRSVDRKDLMRAAKELKANWQMIRKEAETTGRKAMARGKSSAKKAVKRAVSKGKKTVRKSAKKRR